MLLGFTLGAFAVLAISTLMHKSYMKGWKDSFRVTLSLAKGKHIETPHIIKFLEEQLDEKS